MKPLEGEVLKKEREWKYEPWMCDKIIEVAAAGGHVPAMIKAIGIRSKDTFYRWQKEYPEFKAAYEYSKIESQVLHEEILAAGAAGKIKNFNFNALAMIMNNKFSEDYKRSATGSNTEVNIGTMNNLDVLTSPARQAKIQQMLKKLTYLNQEDDDVNDQGCDTGGAA